MSQLVDPQEIPAQSGVIAETAQQSFSDYVNDWLRRVRAGDLGFLPIIVGLIVIAIIFGSLQPVFFSERNFVNLLLQMAGITAIAIGIVFVLLIAEIDLSVAFVSGVGAVIMALLLRESGPNWPWPLAVGAALLSTTAIGLLQGLIITKAGVPSFVVTLAGLLAWSGVVLILTTELSTAGVIVIQNPVVLGIANAFLPSFWGWVLFAVVVVGFAAMQLAQRQSHLRQNLSVKPVSLLALQFIGLAIVTGVVVWYANLDRGVPVVAVIILLLLLFWSFIARRTPFGRYVYAVGGNPEAARRAGINVDRIRIIVFMISGLMAGVGGIILAARLRSVDTNSGGGNLLLNAIAAAVIGGTSLFGGSGRVISALLGALVIASVENGMGLLGLPSGVKFVVTGGVLLAAVLVDSFSRRSRAASGIG
jgi:D-xylose transport system permease protein